MQPEWSKLNMKLSKSQSYQSSDYQYKRPLHNKTKNYMNSQGRLVNTKAYAIAWGIINKPYSSTDLYNKCKNDPESPSFAFITRKCWKGYPRYYNDLVKAGMQPRPPRTDAQKRKLLGKIARKGFRLGLLDKDYNAAKVAAQFGVTTRDSYNKLRKENPDARMLLPSVPSIMKHFGNWTRFSYEIMKYNADAVINQYVKKSAQCGHWLKLSQCDKLKIPIRGIMDMLKPTIFNAVCYKKLALMNKSF